MVQARVVQMGVFLNKSMRLSALFYLLLFAGCNGKGANQKEIRSTNVDSLSTMIRLDQRPVEVFWTAGSIGGNSEFGPTDSYVSAIVKYDSVVFERVKESILLFKPTEIIHSSEIQKWFVNIDIANTELIAMKTEYEVYPANIYYSKTYRNGSCIIFGNGIVLIYLFTT